MTSPFLVIGPEGVNLTAQQLRLRAPAHPASAAHSDAIAGFLPETEICRNSLGTPFGISPSTGMP